MIEFLQERGLLASDMNCHKCQTPMKLVNRAAEKCDKCAWKCPKKSCRALTTVRKGSWFYGMKLPLQKIVLIIHQWSGHTPLNITAQNASVSRSTIVQLFQYLRDVCSWKLMSINGPQQAQLGGPGVVVQIDESLFRHKSKYHRGRAPQKEV